MRVIFLCLFLAGCGTWHHPTKSRAQWDQEMYQCEKDVAAIQDAERVYAVRKRCMELKGWTIK